MIKVNAEFLSLNMARYINARLKLKADLQGFGERIKIFHLTKIHWEGICLVVIFFGIRLNKMGNKSTNIYLINTLLQSK